MKQVSVKYFCEKCKKKIPYGSSLDIVTSLSENTAWSRLHVNVVHQHGINNDVKSENAELCQSCTITLLKDALKRVQAGERATAGTESSKNEGWTEKR